MGYVYVCSDCGHSDDWCALTKLRRCFKCGKGNVRRLGNSFPLRYRVSRSNKYHSAIVFAQGKIESGRRQRAIWEKVPDGRRKDSLFITCPACVSIIDVSLEDICGRQIRGCVVCPECETHFWAHLENWKG